MNDNDEFFYQGDTAVLNRFLEQCGGLKGTPSKVIIHAGSARRSALGDKKAELAYDWKLLVMRPVPGGAGDAPLPKDHSGYVLTVDVWLDGKIELEKLRIPATLKAESGGEIEKFINQLGAGRLADEQPFGQAVDGVQFRLRCDRPRWQVGQTITWKNDIRNTGERHLVYSHAPEAVTIDVDGKVFKLPATRVVARFYDLKPGQEYQDLAFRVDRRWQLKEHPVEIEIVPVQLKMAKG